jgi:hypothetical protein
MTVMDNIERALKRVALHDRPPKRSDGGMLITSPLGQAGFVDKTEYEFSSVLMFIETMLDLD